METLSSEVFTDSSFADFPENNAEPMQGDIEQSNELEFSDKLNTADADVTEMDNSDLSVLPDSPNNMDNSASSTPVHDIDDIYTLLESMISDPDHNIDDIYTFLENCFPVLPEEEMPRNVYMFMETIVENQQSYVSLLKVQNSMLLVMFSIMALICGLIFARIVWRKF